MLPPAPARWIPAAYRSGYAAAITAAMAPPAEPNDVNPPLVDGIVAHDLTSDAGDNRGLTSVTLLVAGTEPVPVAAIVRRSRLLGIGDKERVQFGLVIHPGAGREVRGFLGATVQHDDERHWLADVTGSGRGRTSATRRRRCGSSDGSRRRARLPQPRRQNLTRPARPDQRELPGSPRVVPAAVGPAICRVGRRLGATGQAVQAPRAPAGLA